MRTTQEVYLNVEILCGLTEQRVNVVSKGTSYLRRLSQNRALWECLRVSNDAFACRKRRHRRHDIYSTRDILNVPRGLCAVVGTISYTSSAMLTA